MFMCKICGQEKLSYQKNENEWYLVCECGRRELIIPKKMRCFKCGTEYEEINWCIPSGCSVCYTSFVD